MTALALVGWYLLASLPSSAQGVTKTFTAPNGAFSFNYWEGLIHCERKNQGVGDWYRVDEMCGSYQGVCDDLIGSEELQISIACFAYPRNQFTNTQAFEAATFSIETLDDRKTEKTCLVTEPVEGDEKTGTIRINGSVFTFSDFGAGGGNSGTVGRVYRTFHGGKCYQLGINEGTAQSQVFDPPASPLSDSDEKEINGRLEQALKSFKFLK